MELGTWGLVSHCREARHQARWLTAAHSLPSRATISEGRREVSKFVSLLVLERDGRVSEWCMSKTRNHLSFL